MRIGEAKRKWLNAFGKNVDEIIIREHVTARGNYLWHLFTWGNVKCLEKDEARKAFDALEHKNAFWFREKEYSPKGVVDNSYDPLEKLNNGQTSAFFENINDVIVFDRQLKWTYVHTHETGCGCGPYFCELKEALRNNN